MLSDGLSDIQAQVFAEKYALRNSDGRRGLCRVSLYAGVRRYASAHLSYA